MDFSEVTIEPELTRTYEEEKAWLQSYSDQLRAISQPISAPVYESLSFHPKFIENSINIRNNLAQNRELKKKIEELESFINEKDLKLAEFITRSTSQEFSLVSKIKVLENENSELKIKLEDYFAEKEHYKAVILDFEKNDSRIDLEKEELKARVALFVEELALQKQKIEENEKIIKLKNIEIENIENEKLKALELFQSKEEKLREEIEGSLNILEITQQSEIYYKRMKEYEKMYLDSKTEESEIKELLLNTMNDNFLIEKNLASLKQENLKLFEGYSMLKKDYEHISVKNKSISELYSKLSESYNKELRNSEVMKKENAHLASQVKSLIDRHSDSIFTFTSVEDLLVKNTQMSQILQNYEQMIASLQNENQTLKKSVEVFKIANESKHCEIEEFAGLDKEIIITKDHVHERLAAQNSRMNAEIVYLQNKIKLLESNETMLKNNIESLKNHLNSLMIKVNNSENFNVEEKKISKYAEEIKYLNEKVKSTQSLLESSQERNKKLQESLEKLSNSVMEVEKRNSEIHINNKHKNDDLLNQIFRLNEKNSELQKSYLEIDKKYRQCLNKETAKDEAFGIEMELLRKRNADLLDNIQDLKREHLYDVMSNETVLSELRSQIEVEIQKNALLEEKLGKIESFLNQNMHKIVNLCHKSLMVHKEDN